MRSALVYPIRRDFPPNRGILNKMGYQASALSELGCEVSTICGSMEGLVVDGALVSRYAIPRGPSRILNHYLLFYRHLLTQVDFRRLDLLYLRHPGASPALLAFLAIAKRRNPRLRVVLEVATYPFEGEADDWKARAVVWSDRLSSSQLHRWVDLVVTFCGQDEIYGIPAIATSNGIDVDRIPRGTLPPLGRELTLLGVAAVAKWHGYDRLLRGMAATSDGSVRFEIAGDGPEKAHLEALARELGVVDRVRFHGMLTGAALDELFARSDMAIGSLAMHRIGLSIASSLKNREYCARGIPFVIAAEDEDFPRDECPFVFHEGPSEEPVDVAALVERYARLRATTPRIEAIMREYAEAKLSWRSKLAPVFERLGMPTSEARRGTEATA